ncbi:MAG: hypothetical protein SGI77_03280 [Pirellulaceae bacterium]|nr:hypothetical protein [Pirellulaceae bacterium]
MSSTRDRSEKTMEKRSRKRGSWFETLLHIDPVNIVSDMWDAFDMWRVTRRWRPILFMIPGILLLFVCLGTLTYGMYVSKPKDLKEKYSKKASAVDPLKEDSLSSDDLKAAKKIADGAGSLSTDELESEVDAVSEAEKKVEEALDAKNLDYADLLFRRLLQIDPNEKRARYFVAYQLGLRGQIDQARSMMQSLAPSDSASYPRAHAWVAMDLLQQFYKGQKVDPRELSHHLLIAAESPYTDPVVLSAYASMLEKEGNNSQAINMMQRAASRNNAYFLPLAAMMARHNQPVQAKEAADRAISFHSESFGKKDETDYSRIAVAEIHVQSKKFDEAIKVLREGLSLRENRPQLRRALSNVYRLMYRSQLTKTEAGIKANLGLLNMAIMTDPTNPGVGEEIAWLQTLGVTADDNMIQALREQLATGGASAVSHLLLGNAYMNKVSVEKDANEEENDKYMTKAMSHWQLAMGQDPNLVLAMNNLAVGFSMLKPPKIKEAISIIDRAIELSDGDAEFFDSKGEILDRAGRPDEAIIEYEKALRSDPMRVATRDKLVRSYQAAGMMDEADAHEKKAASIRAQLKISGLNEKGRPVPKTPPPPMAAPPALEKKDDVVQRLDDDFFSGLPSNKKEAPKNEPGEKK